MFVKLIISIFLFGSLIAKDINKTKEKEPTRTESYEKLQRVLNTVEATYVDKIKLNEIVNKAITGLLSELDAHSSYMGKSTYKNFEEHMKGEFGGLGIVVGMRNGALTVISPIDDTPAYKAGVESEDIILKINDKSTLGMTLNEAVSIMRGKVGTKIDITIVRKDENKPILIHIIRGVISVKSVAVKTNKDILYIRIASFDNNVEKQLKKFIKKYKKKTKGIVLDLRNNPGGSLMQAIKTVDLFIDKGVIVSQKGRDKSQEKSYSATKKATLTKVPMVTLVNGGSASASEIVSGALQDHNRSVIIGKKTFGKGSVQIVLPLDIKNTEAIKITIAKYYLPSGRTIQAKGIEPDIISERGKAVKIKEDEFAIKEKDLKKHLENELEKIDKKKKKKSKKKKKEDKTKLTNDAIYNDNQLKTAVDVLRALIITKQ